MTAVTMTQGFEATVDLSRSRASLLARWRALVYAGLLLLAVGLIQLGSGVPLR
jgi:hypothetical protein